MQCLICILIVMVAATCLDAQNSRAGRRRFEALCTSCHGADGTGGEHGPAIVGREESRVRSAQDLRDIIRNGIQPMGMPAFQLTDQQLDELAAYVNALRSPAAHNPSPGDIAAGEQFFFGQGNCNTCHMVRGRGSWIGPDLSDIATHRSLSEIEGALSQTGRRTARGYTVATVRLRDGSSFKGMVKNESTFDMQLLGLDGRLHLLARDEIAAEDREKNSLMPPVKANESEMRDLLAYLSRLNGDGPLQSTGEAGSLPGAVPFSRIANPKPGDWPTYHGVLTGNRHSPLNQINGGNIASLAARWSFAVGNSRKLEVTPVVVDGVFYVTTVNSAYALDARTGREIWRFERRQSQGLVDDAAGGINRGVAILGDRVFLVTDNAHLLALHRLTGSLLWETVMADSHVNYGATSAPLVVHDLVISGTSGGDDGIRGFVAAYKASTCPPGAGMVQNRQTRSPQQASSFCDDEHPDRMGGIGEELVRIYMTRAAPPIQPAAIEQQTIRGVLASVRIQAQFDILDEDGMIIAISTARNAPSSVDPMHRFELTTGYRLASGPSGVVRSDTLVTSQSPQCISQVWEINEADIQLTNALYPVAQDAMRRGYYMPNRASIDCSRHQCPHWRRCEQDFGGVVEP